MSAEQTERIEQITNEIIKAQQDGNILLESALRYLKADCWIFPILPGTKEPNPSLAPHGFKSASNDLNQILTWWAQVPDSPIGIDLGRSNLTVLDFDNGLPPVGLNLPDTLEITTARGTHAYFLGVSKQGNMYFDGKHLGEIKSDGGYVIGATSKHPSGAIYTVSKKCGIVDLPCGLLDRLRAAKKDGEFEKKPEGWINDPIVHGNINNALTAIAGYYVQNKNIDDAEILYTILAKHADSQAVHKDGVTPFSCNQDEIRKIAEGAVSRWKTGEQKRQESALVLNQVPTVAPLVLVEADAPPERYALSPEEIDAEMEKDYPVIPLIEQAGPEWSDDIMYGICGDIIRKASQYCEAHPAGMYLDLLVALGNIAGRNPYFNVGQTRHFTNEFMCRVGLTAESRKGTGRDIVDEILRLADAPWYRDRIMSGFGSAEAIINELRDPMAQSVRNKKVSGGFETIVVPGIADKRLCIREGELASVFQLAGKKESRADIVLRDGWDGKVLRNLVKGKSRDGLSNSAICTEPHFSISGDTTRAELIAKMPSGAADNGFGNRFLYCYVYRTKVCPNGGPQLDWTKEVQRLYVLIQFAKELGYVPLTKSASKVWARMYMELDEPGNRLPGLAGSMTARGAAHIRRLALIYALFDEIDVVETRHLHAAKRMWDYCQSSAKFIFTGTTAEQDRILDFVRRNREVTVTQIVQDLFKKNKTVGWVESQVDSLVRSVSSGVTRNGDKIAVKG
jgi:hypothetical protein